MLRVDQGVGHPASFWNAGRYWLSSRHRVCGHATPLIAWVFQFVETVTALAFAERFGGHAL